MFRVKETVITKVLLTCRGDDRWWRLKTVVLTCID